MRIMALRLVTGPHCHHCSNVAKGRIRSFQPSASLASCTNVTFNQASRFLHLWDRMQIVPHNTIVQDTTKAKKLASELSGYDIRLVSHTNWIPGQRARNCVQHVRFEAVLTSMCDIPQQLVRGTSIDRQQAAAAAWC